MLIRTPGFEKEMVLPIPTPERVPIPKDSFGLKYICLLRLNLTLFSGIDLNVNFLETSLKTVVAVCADATVESTRSSKNSNSGIFFIYVKDSNSF